MHHHVLVAQTLVHWFPDRLDELREGLDVRNAAVMITRVLVEREQALRRFAHDEHHLGLRIQRGDDLLCRVLILIGRRGIHPDVEIAPSLVRKLIGPGFQPARMDVDGRRQLVVPVIDEPQLLLDAACYPRVLGEKVVQRGRPALRDAGDDEIGGPDQGVSLLRIPRGCKPGTALQSGRHQTAVRVRHHSA